MQKPRCAATVPSRDSKDILHLRVTNPQVKDIFRVTTRHCSELEDWVLTEKNNPQVEDIFRVTTRHCSVLEDWVLTEKKVSEGGDEKGDGEDKKGREDGVQKEKMGYTNSNSEDNANGIPEDIHRRLCTMITEEDKRLAAAKNTNDIPRFRILKVYLSSRSSEDRVCL